MFPVELTLGLHSGCMLHVMYRWLNSFLYINVSCMRFLYSKNSVLLHSAKTHCAVEPGNKAIAHICKSSKMEEEYERVKETLEKKKTRSPAGY